MRSFYGCKNWNSQNPAHPTVLRHPIKKSGGDGISTILSIPCHHWAARLGPANPGLIIIAQETLDFRRAGFSPAFQLLIPTFSLVSAPSALAGQTSQLLTMLLYHPSPRLRVAFGRILALFCFATLFNCTDSEGCPTKLYAKSDRDQLKSQRRIRVFGTKLSPNTLSAPLSPLSLARKYSSSELLHTL